MKTAAKKTQAYTNKKKTTEKRNVAHNSTNASAIDRTMTIAQILDWFPQTQSIMQEYGLHCLHCSFNTLDALIDVGPLHGLSEEEVALMITDMNELIASSTRKPSTLTITKSAAEAIAQIAKKEKKVGYALSVALDEHGGLPAGRQGFCMEFRKDADPSDHTFTNADVPSVRVLASGKMLARIGGATIDYREGRFKLDLEQGKSCVCNGKECGCK